ncbi:ABC transporter permease [Singulisphaera sp. Ch08]|uniref:ABC transporter permease n=1 Tax=Singulisphaera sp. Ch08 TaxID=3120278 RepID=A0AAU7CR53_9BACT
MSKIWNIIRLAVRNLGLHKLRVLLTALGLIFGVSSVIAMLAIAEGASAEAQKQLAELGATNVILRSIKPVDDINPSKQSNDSFVFNYGLTNQDFERIMNTIPTVVGATPLREFHKNVRYLERELEGRIVGANPDCLKITGQKLAKGRFLTDLDMSLAANVAVIGSEVSQKLFPFGDPLGKAVRLGESHYYRIIGVTGHKAPSGGTGSSLAAQDLNKDVYIPLTTDRARFGEVLMGEKQGQFSAERIELSQITVTVRGMDDVKVTASALESMLRQFHPRVDYSITVPLELLEKAEATKRIFNLVLGSIAGISLIVGGIGIMNIMLATVSERTREIGIRRALGAKRRDIVLQFLIETVVISASGGGIGVILGIAVPPLVSHFSGVPAVIRPESPIIAFMIAVVIGVIFGVYPARRAAMMDPVEALRSE